LTACSATKRTVQRARPSGGGPQTIATTAASCVLSSSGPVLLGQLEPYETLFARHPKL
jgi:hypothetical protein